MPLFASPRLYRSPCLALGILTILLALPVVAEEGVAPPAEGAPAESSVPELLRAPRAAQVTAGLRVFLDPSTGEIVSRPSDERVRRLQQSVDELRSAAPAIELHPFYLRHGGTGVYVGDRFMTSTVVRRSADGSLVVDCGSDPHHVHHSHPPSDPRSKAPVK